MSEEENQQQPQKELNMGANEQTEHSTQSKLKSKLGHRSRRSRQYAL